jgi:hypothetical protein
VLLDFDCSTRPLADVLLVYRWPLLDHNSAFHLALDHVDFGVSPALKRVQTLEHCLTPEDEVPPDGGVCRLNYCKRRANQVGEKGSHSVEAIC